MYLPFAMQNVTVLGADILANWWGGEVEVKEELLDQ